jgi:hypothetical protein
MSAVEALASTAVGFGVAWAATYTVLPLFELVPTVADTTAITAIFTFISLVRGYALRRLFDAIRNGW